MTGQEVINRILELGAKGMEVLCINFDGLISHVHKVDVSEDVQTGDKKIVIT